MSTAEVDAIHAPSFVTRSPHLKLVTYTYRETAFNRIGEYPVGDVTLVFFDDILYNVTVGVSKFSEQIHEACRITYGEPTEHRTEKDSTGNSAKIAIWRGNKIAAGYWQSADSSTGFTGLRILDPNRHKEAQSYAEKEPERAALDFNNAGFKTLVLGKTIAELALSYELVSEEPSAKTSRIRLTGAELKSIGSYPLNEVFAECFDGKVFRIDLSFPESFSNEILEAFKAKYGPLQVNIGWKRGTTQLSCLSGRSGNVSAYILGLELQSGKVVWESIVLRDSRLWEEAARFKAGAPQRAAKDL